MERVITLVRNLVAYGRELAASVQDRITADPRFGSCTFGTNNLTVIIASITRGLRRALALEAWLDELAKRPAPKPRPARAPSTSAKPRAPRPPAPPDFDPDLTLDRIPTEAEIAAEVRRRPIGATIADICRDLGLPPSHPLFREVREALYRYRGNLARLMQTVFARSFLVTMSAAELAALPPPVIPPPWPSPAGTGPPR